MWWFVSGWSVAHAGACCVGSTSAVPSRLGECEHVLVGAGVGGELGLLRWDTAGTVASASPEEEALVGTAVVAGRWSRWGQAAVVVPTRWSHRSASDLVDDGGGLGDLRVSSTVDAFEERLGPKQGGLPVPVLSLGLRLPTGRDWTDSEGPLLADVTGTPGVGVSAMLSVERTLGRFPYWGAADLGVDPDVPSRLGVSGGFGQYVGTNWTWLANLRHEEHLSADGASRTSLGARLVHGKRLSWRGWFGLSSDLPISGLGSDLPMVAGADLGLALVR